MGEWVISEVLLVYAKSETVESQQNIRKDLANGFKRTVIDYANMSKAKYDRHIESQVQKSIVAEVPHKE